MQPRPLHPAPPPRLSDTDDLERLASFLREVGFTGVAQMIDLGSTIAWNRDAPGDRHVVVKAAREAAALRNIVMEAMRCDHA